MCPECKVEADAKTCPDCGTDLSVTEDMMDTMVQAASIPNLGSLFQAAKDKGLIKAGVEYGSTV